MRIVVLGIGSVLMRDDGLGVHLIRVLSREYDFAASIELIDGGTSGMELLPEIASCDLLIAIDAVRASLEPATLVRLCDEQVPTFFKTKLSPHQAGLSDILATLTFQCAAPRHVVLIGMQPADISAGMTLSPLLEAHFGELVDAVLQEIGNNGGAPRKRA